MYYKLDQGCVINWGSIVLLQICAASLLQIGAAITD